MMISMIAFFMSHFHFFLVLAACTGFASALPPSYKVVLLAGDGSEPSSGDGGKATSASLYHPGGVWQNSVGTLFIVERDGNRVRAISSLGMISTVAGTGSYSFSGDNGPVRLSSYCISYHL
jgi:hypothetical protein